MSGPAFRIGYNTNGFAHHRLDDALHVIAELGYRAVALTPDANHLPPYHTSDAQLRTTRALLEQLDLAVVVETGARYVLDPRRKHRPTLVDADAADRARRLDFLVRCAEIVVALGGDTISLWSGVPAAGVTHDDAWRFLAEGVVALHDRVTPLRARIAFEPEPGMLVQSLADWERLREATALSSLGLDHKVSSERISSGIPRLDGMLGGKGFYRGSTVLLSGTAGTGKTTLSAHFVDAACARGEKCLYFLFEESPQQMIRNMRSAGIELQGWVDQGLLKFHADRPNRHGLETHLLEMHHMVEVFKPQVVVMDPVTNLLAVGTSADVRSMLTRVIDYLKSNGITAMFTSLTNVSQPLEYTESLISSLMDSWVLVTAETVGTRRKRRLYVLKSRGMPHSDEVHEFSFTARGVQLRPVGKRPSPQRARGARRARA